MSIRNRPLGVSGDGCMGYVTKGFAISTCFMAKGMMQPTGSTTVDNLHNHKKKDFELSNEKQPVYLSWL